MLPSLVEILDPATICFPVLLPEQPILFTPLTGWHFCFFFFLDCVPDEESTTLWGSEIPPLLQANCGNLAKVCNYLRSCSEIPTLTLEPLLPVLFILSEIHSSGLLN